MEIALDAAEYRSAKELIEAARQVRRRLMTARKQKSPPVRVVLATHEPVAKRKAPRKLLKLPIWQVLNIRFDEHVVDFHRAKMAALTPLQTYLKARCEEMGVDYETVVKSQSRNRVVVRVRQTLMWEIKAKWPMTTLPEIGRIFGGRDHTTALHGIRRIDQERGTNVLGHSVRSANRKDESNGKHVL